MFLWCDGGVRGPRFARNHVVPIRNSDSPKGNQMKPALLAGAAAVALMAAPAAYAQSRDQIRIVGSSTVFPYTQAVAEQFGAMTGGRAPVVESTGTGGGMQIFCQGVGPEHPDLPGASR